MIHWAWLIVAAFGGVTLGALMLGICAAAGNLGAYNEGYARGLDVGTRTGYEAAMCDAVVREEAA